MYTVISVNICVGSGCGRSRLQKRGALLKSNKESTEIWVCRVYKLEGCPGSGI